MCFGNQTQKTTTNTPTPNPAVAAAATQNLNFAQNLQNQGFTPYTGQQVADFSPQQSASFTDASNLNSSVNGGPIGQLTSNYANAPASSVRANTIASQMSPYMNQYVNLALQPQLQMQDQQFATQNKGVDSAAAMAGAFGDTGWGQLRGTTTQAQNAARAGLVGNAYNAAFNTAIGAGAQDVSNNLNAQTTNAGLNETALGRQLTGANAMQGQQTGAANLQNQYGGQQTAQQQADLNAKYNQWLMAQQYPFQTAQLLNQTVAAGAAGMPPSTTSVQSAPDNSGFGLLGAGLGALGTYAGTPTGGAALSAGLAMLADGGPLTPGKPTIVGERGPELIIPGAQGVVVPNEVLEAARDKRAGKLAQPKLNFGIAA